MHLTPKQQEIVQQAKVSGKNRAVLRFTEEQEHEWLDSLQKELAGKDENIAYLRKLRAAAKQPGLFGDIRRAIQCSGLSIEKISASIECEPKALSAFLSADEELPAVTLGRLVDTLGLRLMQEISR